MDITKTPAGGEPAGRRVHVEAYGTLAEFIAYKSASKDYKISGGSTFVVTSPFTVYMYDESVEDFLGI